MKRAYLNALQFGFSTQDAQKIEKMGLSQYIKQQLQANNDVSEPSFLQNSPKNLSDYRALRQSVAKDGNELEKITKQIIKTGVECKAFFLQRCLESEYPLKEKINLFFQNHFVVTLQSVKVPYWIFQHYKTINQNSVGNYKTLVKEMVYSNAMLKYLDNQQNRKDKVNENLARELLELFTLGEGNYSESDIKNTALALVGLTFGDNKGEYRRFLTNNDTKTVFGKSGNFKIDEVIDIIFEQNNTAYFLAEKALKWFFYDNPPQKLILKYGDILKENQFELKPFFQALLEQEGNNEKGGNQIKNPLLFFGQIHHDLQLKPNYKLLAFLLKNQSMDIYDQPNVKGWKGGQQWLTSQIYADRNQFVDYIIDGNKRFEQVLNQRFKRMDVGMVQFTPQLKLEDHKNAHAIINELVQKTIFESNDEMQQELNQILKYDFNPMAENADKSILKIYQYLAKSPEFQII